MHCTLYEVCRALYIVRGVKYVVRCALYSCVIRSMKYVVRCTLYVVRDVKYVASCTLYEVVRASCSTQR